MINEVWETLNQLKMNEGFRAALKEKKIICIIDHPGTGFKHAFRRFSNLNSDVRSVFVEIPIGKKSTREITLDMLTQIMTIRFNNFKYKTPSPFDLLRVLGERVKQDLRGKKILIVFDGIDNLSKKKLADFMLIIKGINFPCGIVLRFGADYYKKIKSNEKLYNEFWLFTEWRKVTTPNTPEDIEKLCRFYGLDNPIFIREICDRTTSFTVAMSFIKKHNNYRPPSQLNLFSQNPVRI
ncbi:hypothetical protein SanaruYs_05700 [Chryseotalea sanaruensis]|uniref:AAA+ ATPase domain-containing protein n=1 Tax=Chryseotalea sanaruensis TaxID=2482724 RepID=A0A401U649_9BACT|nr:hypothetical protein [Chryseotalea sanaruensis]GCC50355.1 hypothetical protein SanaruYs_05700 [Chryseotalea sanaruensis]